MAKHIIGSDEVALDFDELMETATSAYVELRERLSETLNELRHCDTEKYGKSDLVHYLVRRSYAAEKLKRLAAQLDNAALTLNALEYSTEDRRIVIVKRGPKLDIVMREE